MPRNLPQETAAKKIVSKNLKKNFLYKRTFYPVPSKILTDLQREHLFQRLQLTDHRLRRRLTRFMNTLEHDVQTVFRQFYLGTITHTHLSQTCQQLQLQLHNASLNLPFIE
jgi:hypothetical protein